MSHAISALSCDKTLSGSRVRVSIKPVIGGARLITRRVIALMFISLILSGFMLATHAHAQTDEALPTEPATAVKVKAWLGDKPDANPDGTEKLWAPTEQILLQIEVSTNRWFTSGTQIKGIEIPNVLVKQRNTFAVNYTEQEDGQTWSRQRWEIALYPQTSGDFSVPEATVITQVAGVNGDKQAVTLTTPAMGFRVALPSAELASTKAWFAASDVKVQQEWSPNEAEVLKVGDSLVRTIHIEANDSLSVLLPNLMPAQASPDWKLYPTSPELVDKQSREGYVSSRIDSQTYVLQHGGDVSWPEYRLWWWNTQSGQLEQIVLEGKTIKVKHTLSSWLKYHAWTLFTLLLSAAILGLLIRWGKAYYQTHPIPVWLVFYRALRRGEWQTCRALLYRRLRRRKQLLSMTAASTEPDWQAAALRLQTHSTHRADFIYLWKRIKRVRMGLALPKALVALEKQPLLTEKVAAEKALSEPKASES